MSEFRKAVRSLSCFAIRCLSVTAAPTINPVPETVSISKPILVSESGGTGKSFNAMTMPKLKITKPVTTRFIPWRMATQMIGTNAK